MGFIDSLKAYFTGYAASKNYIYVTIRCKRCGELIQSMVNLNNDISYEENGDSSGFVCHKGMMGTGTNYCYEKFEVTLRFDEQKKVLSTEIIGKAELVSIN